MKNIFYALLLLAFLPNISFGLTAEELGDYSIPLPEAVSIALMRVASEKGSKMQRVFEDAGVAFASDTSVTVDSKKHVLHMRLNRPNALLILFILSEAINLSEQEAYTYLSFKHDSCVVESIERKAEQGAAANP